MIGTYSPALKDDMKKYDDLLPSQRLPDVIPTAIERISLKLIQQKVGKETSEAR